MSQTQSSHPDRRLGLILLIVGSIAVLGIVGGMLIGVLFGSYAQEKENTDQKIAEAFTSVDVDVEAGEITIVEDDRLLVPRLQVEKSWRGMSQPEVKVAVVAGELRVKASSPKAIFLGLPTGSESNVKITLPSKGDYLKSVKVKNNVGSINIRTGSETVNADSNIGDVTLELGSFTAPTSTRATSNVGKVTVHVPFDSFQIEASSNLGRTEVNLIKDNPAARNTIKASSNIGNVFVSAVE